MKNELTILLTSLLFSSNTIASEHKLSDPNTSGSDVIWDEKVDTEAFWKRYAESRGGLTWGTSSTYPEYDKVNEGDTLIIQLQQGPCLMEFFHSRWRRANDVRRWDESVNEFGGCPYVFD